MSDLLMQLHANPLTAWLARVVGLPSPVPLEREEGGYCPRPLAGKNVLLRSAETSPLNMLLSKALEEMGGQLVEGASVGVAPINVVVVDVTNCRAPIDLRLLYNTFNPIVRQLPANARVMIVANDPDQELDPVVAAVSKGMEGFGRSLGKELGKKGIPVNLVFLGEGAESRLKGPIRYLCAKQTTYVSGQVFRVDGRVVQPAQLPTEQVLAGKIALVTGSARGIGLATAQRLAQEGAKLVCLDVPAVEQELEQRCRELGATPLLLDISAPDAPRRLADFLVEQFGGVDIVVHNAGITRDRTLANMSEHFWDQVVAVNLASIVAVDEMLLAEEVLRNEGRVVCLSSISGVAGNYGQTNYAATKSALIGYVKAQAAHLAERGISINAIAPGFIETPMTDAMPFVTREIGRRLNSFKQGGKPRDAAELIVFLCSPHSYGITGNTIRVCGQGLIGA